jgi:hypothetical protein
MAVQISHSIYTEIPETAAIWVVGKHLGEVVSPIARAKRMVDRTRACHAGSRVHVDQCAAEIGGIERGGIHQGQECDSRGEITLGSGFGPKVSSLIRLDGILEPSTST